MGIGIAGTASDGSDSVTGFTSALPSRRSFPHWGLLSGILGGGSIILNIEIERLIHIRPGVIVFNVLDVAH